jgi:hypothetical protein
MNIFYVVNAASKPISSNTLDACLLQLSEQFVTSDRLEVFLKAFDFLKGKKSFFDLTYVHLDVQILLFEKMSKCENIILKTLKDFVELIVIK